MRIATIALSMALMALPLAAPFIDVLIARGGWRWMGAYGLIVAMGAAATALAVGLTVALFRLVGPKRTRFVAQVVAAVIGAAFRHRPAGDRDHVLRHAVARVCR